MAKPTKPVKKKKVIQGRPVIPIDWKRVEQLLMADCSGVQVAASMGISEDTLYLRVKKELGYESFTAYSLKFKEKGNSLLKSKQYESAITDKNISMQIWLGKQRLGQKDKSDITSGEKPIQAITQIEIIKVSK